MRGGADSCQRAIEGDLLYQLTTAGDTFGRVFELDVVFDGIKQRRSKRDKTVCGETVHHPTDMRVDAEDFLHHHQRTLGRNWRVRTPRSEEHTSELQTLSRSSYAGI